MSETRRIGLAGALLAAVTGLLASDGVAWGELGLTEWLNALPQPVVDVLRLVMQLGALPAIVLVAAVTVVVAGGDWKRVALTVAVAGGLSWTAAELAKDVVDRPRPTAYSVEIVVRDHESSPGWPSSHTAVATGSLVAAALVARQRPYPALALGSLVGVGRMAAGVHLPLDVLGGLGIGTAAAVLVVELVDR